MGDALALLGAIMVAVYTLIGRKQRWTVFLVNAIYRENPFALIFSGIDNDEVAVFDETGIHTKGFLRWLGKSTSLWIGELSIDILIIGGYTVKKCKY